MSACKCKYSRDSFERFGDDLCELIVGHLSVTDCFEFECVAKQWRRLAFNRQNRLVFDLKHNRKFTQKLIAEIDGKYTISWLLLERLLQKCTFVNDITIGYAIAVDDQLFRVIGNNCQYLKAIKVKDISVRNISAQTWAAFADKRGHRLERIAINSLDGIDKHSIKSLLRLTPNLIECKTVEIGDCIGDSGEPVLPKLRRIWGCIQADSDLNRFAQQYHNRLEKINVMLFDYTLITDSAVRSVFSCFSCFTKLKQLIIIFNADQNFTDNTVNAGLALIAKSCQQLQELTVDGIFNYSKVLRNISHKFVSLKKLELIDFHSFEGTVQCLSCCPNLVFLDIFGKHLTDDNFTDIAVYAPNLRVIKINCFDHISDRTLESVAKLQNLCWFEIRVMRSSSISDSGVRHLITSCPTIREILIDFHASITQTTINAFFSLAFTNPKVNYYFSNLPVFGKVKAKFCFDCYDLVLPNNIKVDLAIQ